eukprot:04250_3
MFPNDNVIYAHISSKVSSKATSSERFEGNIIASMNDMKTMIEQYLKDHPPAETKKSKGEAEASRRLVWLDTEPLRGCSLANLQLGHSTLLHNNKFVASRCMQGSSLGCNAYTHILIFITVFYPVVHVRSLSNA